MWSAIAGVGGPALNVRSPAEDPLRILVYPHMLTVGGSQLNAVELAGAVRDLGHEVIVFGTPGPLVEVVHDLRLPYVESPQPGRRPSAVVIRALSSLVEERAIDVLHAYEWPPAIECYVAGSLLRRRPTVCTVMSMGVAPFIPSHLPLVVGTRHIQATEERRRRAEVTLLEPPVDTTSNRPDVDGSDLLPAGVRSPDPDVLHIVVVSRLAHELKLQGLLEAISVMPQLAAEFRVRLVVVGGGPAAEAVAAAARRSNELCGEEVVVLAGELLDPRPAYALADVALGMGGSALRAMAFGRPLVVQGERGFWEELSPETVDRFLYQGWYGTGDGQDGGPRLLELLRRLLQDADRRRTLGAYGRGLVVERFSLARAARTQVEVYARAARDGVEWPPPPVETCRAAAGLVRHETVRRVRRLLGAGAADDFNALSAQPDPVAVP